MSEAIYDAVVVGGGPSGATAARELARLGARTLVLDRDDPPRYKTCGGGLTGRSLGLLPAPAREQIERSLDRSRIGLGAGLGFGVRRSAPVVGMSMRGALDEALLAAAADAGAEVRAPCVFDDCEVDAGGVTVRTRGGAVRTRLLVAADGAAGRVARAAGWGPLHGCIPALEAELRVDDATFARFCDEARFDFDVAVPGYAWVFPKREHLSVGILSMRAGRWQLRRELEAYLATLGIAPTAPLELHGFVIPVRPRDEPARGPVVLLGDAAGLADPVTAEGISQGLRSARLLAASWQSCAGETLATTRHFAAGLAAELLPELRLARGLAAGLYGAPRLRSAVARRCGQSLCEAMTDVVTGERSYRELAGNPRGWWRALRHAAAGGTPAARLAPTRGD